MSSITLSTRLSHDKVAFGKKHVVHLLASLTGVKPPSKTRKPLSISVAIDCSGSMGGAKMEHAKQSLEKLVEHLGAQDTLSVTAFSTTVWPVFGPFKMDGTGKDQAKIEIRKLHSTSATNLSGAVLEAYGKLSAADVKKGTVSRAFLFTDGLPTAGEMEFESLSDIAGRRPEGAALTAFGYGDDHDPELLRSMSKRGGGNFWFIETPDACAPIFGRELGGLLSCVAQSVKLTLETKTDVQILSVENDLDVDANDEKTKATVTVDDVYGEETRKVLFKLEIPSMAKATRPFKLGDLKIAYEDLLEKKGAAAECTLKIEYVPEDKAQKKPDVDVEEQLAILNAAKAQEEARLLANQGQFVKAQGVVKHALMACRAVGTKFSGRVADDLQHNVLHRLAPESYAMGGQSFMVSNAHGYTRGRGANVGTAGLFSTEAQEETASSFTEDPKPSLPLVSPPPMMSQPPKAVRIEPTKAESLSKRRRNRS